MRSLLLTLFITFNVTTKAKADLLPKNYFLSCPAKVNAILGQWNQSPYNWIKEIAPDSSMRWVSPTHKIGEAVIITTRGQSTIAAKSSELTSIAYIVSPPHCEPRLTVSHLKNASKTDSGFSNIQLESLLRKGDQGIIFAVSPGMVHSKEALKDIEKVAEKLKLKLTILRDPEFRSKQFTEYPLLNSSELIMRGMSLHYPSMIYYASGELKGEALVGRKSEEQYLDWIKGIAK